MFDSVFSSIVAVVTAVSFTVLSSVGFTPQEISVASPSPIATPEVVPIYPQEKHKVVEPTESLSTSPEINIRNTEIDSDVTDILEEEDPDYCADANELKSTLISDMKNNDLLIHVEDINVDNDCETSLRILQRFQAIGNRM